MSGPYTLRPMVAADYDAVSALWQSIPGLGLNAIDDSRAGIEKYLARNPGLSFVAQNRAGVIVGGIQCGHDGRRGLIHHTCVLPELQGTGLGKRLVAAALEALRAEGICKALLMCFKANQPGNAFWQHLDATLRDDLNFYNFTLIKP